MAAAAVVFAPGGVDAAVGAVADVPLALEADAELCGVLVVLTFGAAADVVGEGALDDDAADDADAAGLCAPLSLVFAEPMLPPILPIV